MIHSRSPPPRTPQRRRRPTNSGRILLGSAKSIKQDEPIILTDQKVQFETNNNNNNISKRKKFFVIAPDVFIPNSTYRTVFKRKEIKPVVTKEFQLRLDILNNLPRANSSFLGDEDDEWMELDDPDQPTKPTSAKKTRALNTPVSQQKETVPDLFKRMQNEPWWKQGKDEKSNMRSMLLYLIEIIKLKQTESYESACFYVIEVFRSYGIEPTYINQVLNIFRENLKINANEQLDICTIRSIAQFMIERKDIIIYLLEYAIKCQSMDNIRLEVINAIKFITDVNNSEEIDLVLENMSAVYNSPEEDFSLQAIIKLLQKKSTTVPSEETTEEEPRDETHPLLRKISEERWFPRGQLSITLDCVLDAIITKLQDTTKTMVKTLTTHLIQLHRNIGYTIEQFDRVSKSLISLLSNIDADYRLIAATSLAQFDKETKTIDIALLKSFINDPRILVRTECCDSLKKLTGVMSDIVLTDCANDIEHLQTLPEENFSLESYLREKNRLPTPPPRHVDEPPIVSVEEVPPIRSPSPPLPPVNEQSTTVDPVPPPVKPEAIPVSHTESLTSSMTSIRPSIRVEINDKQNNIRKERTSIQITRKSRQSNASSVPDQNAKKRTILLPNNAQMWDSYNKQLDNESNFIRAPQSSSINSEHEKDSVQILLEEHKQNVGFIVYQDHVVYLFHIKFQWKIFSPNNHILLIII